MDSTVTTVFVAIGTNDCYRGDLSCNLRLQLLKVYPNAKELYVIWGSRGWGGVKYSTIDQQERFYKKFESNGFNQIKVRGGYFSNMKKSHSVNGDFFIEIVNRLNDINN